ncbi:MAG: CvpA family protein [Candidatus Omnitrophica bacterium]|nr:CvpA family protein [Candidatus Omnitrophota bacterium]
MFEDILKNTNWLDIITVAILLRCVYIGISKGLVAEELKLVGVLVAMFITQHYFVVFADFLHDFVAIPVFMAEITAFVILWLIVLVLFKFIREGLFLFLKKKSVSGGKRIIGGLLGISRGVLICSLLFPIMFLSGSEYLDKTARSSFAGFYIIDLSSKAYKEIFSYIVKPFFPNEERNEKALRLKHLDGFKPDKSDKGEKKVNISQDGNLKIEV